MAGQIATLGGILQPEQFTFLMQIAVQPLIQFRILGHLCSLLQQNSTQALSPKVKSNTSEAYLTL